MNDFQTDEMVSPLVAFSVPYEKVQEFDANTLMAQSARGGKGKD